MLDIHMNAGYATVQIWLGNLLIDKKVVKIDACCIIACVGIVNPAHSRPVKCTQAHWARLARGIHHAAIKFEIMGQATCTAYGVDLGMRCGVVVDGY